MCSREFRAVHACTCAFAATNSAAHNKNIHYVANRAVMVNLFCGDAIDLGRSQLQEVYRDCRDIGLSFTQQCRSARFRS